MFICLAIPMSNLEKNLTSEDKKTEKKEKTSTEKLEDAQKLHAAEDQKSALKAQEQVVAAADRQEAETLLDNYINEGTGSGGAANGDG